MVTEGLFCGWFLKVSCSCLSVPVGCDALQREVQQILVLMFPFKAARLKADIQQQACREAGPHSPALWGSTVVHPLANTDCT